MLGKTVTDSITGFSGVVTGYVEYLTGCHQCLVQPKCGDDWKEPHWFDVDRLVADGSPAIELERKTANGCDVSAPIR